MRTTRLRTTLILLGVLPALLAFVVLSKVLIMMSHDRGGREDFAATEFVAAAGHFGANQVWNWFEPWIAPFDEGAAVHAEGHYEDAIVLYDEALQTVPDVEECTVRINQALAHEALGDVAQSEVPPDREAAVEHWQAGIDTLAEGECPTDSGRGEEQTEKAATVEERLREKIEQEQQPEQESPEAPPPQQSTPQEEELEERNQQGKEDRQEQRDGRSPEQQDELEPENGGGTGSQPGVGEGTPAPAW